LIDWLIGWLNTFIANISILSNAHGAWPMFWPVLRRCRILRCDSPVSADIGASFHFPFWRTLVHAGFWLFPQSCDTCMLVSVCFHNLVTCDRDCRIFKCVLDVLNAYTHWTSVYHLCSEGRESSAPMFNLCCCCCWQTRRIWIWISRFRLCFTQFLSLNCNFVLLWLSAFFCCETLIYFHHTRVLVSTSGAFYGP
jgi:hypothetical protein